LPTEPLINNQPTPILVSLRAVLSHCTGRTHAADSPPNVLFLAVDDINDWIGCLETTPHAIAPNIDTLAAWGVNFSNAHTAGVFCAVATGNEPISMCMH
jgi:arylsulfatase A-like enzyme